MSDSFAKKVIVQNELGLHVRAATKLVQLASIYPCDVFVEKGGQEVNGKSIMGVIMLVASKGSELTIRAEGTKAEEAVSALVELVNNRFDEESA